MPHIGDKNGILWNQQHSKDKWSVYVRDIRVGKDGGESIDSSGYETVIDTGSTQIAVPLKLFKKFSKAVEGGGQEVKCGGTACSFPATGPNLDCDTSKLPSLYFQFKNELLFEITPEYLVQRL